MSREQAQSILKTIEGWGYRAYLVGGCVRDLLLGREPEDWDIASAARPEQIMEIFGAAAFPTGLKHGTVTVKAADGAYEITTFRTDGSYSDGRHPDAVKFAKTIDEDLARRDLTINAMALDSAGNIVDPFDGAGDLKRRVVRCVGDAGSVSGRMRCASCGLCALPRCWAFLWRKPQAWPFTARQSYWSGLPPSASWWK